MNEVDQPDRDEDDSIPPVAWRHLRRDLPPHHGFLLNVQGAISLVLALIGLVFPPLLLVTFSLALGVYIQAQRDLARMKAGCMDPSGRDETVRGKAAAELGWLTSFIGLAFWAIVGFLLLREVSHD
jgi:hypothetical protein